MKNSINFKIRSTIAVAFAATFIFGAQSALAIVDPNYLDEHAQIARDQAEDRAQAQASIAAANAEPAPAPAPAPSPSPSSSPSPAPAVLGVSDDQNLLLERIEKLEQQLMDLKLENRPAAPEIQAGVSNYSLLLLLILLIVFAVRTEFILRHLETRLDKIKKSKK